MVQVVTISPKIKVDEISSVSDKKRNKKSKSDAPDLLKVSLSDKSILSADKQGRLQLRSLSNEEETKDSIIWSVSAHQERITAIAFINEDTVASVSANTSESCTLWRVGKD